MIKATNASPAKVNVAQGSIVEHCCQFTSDKDLRGRKVTVDLGLFLSQSNDTGKLSPAWQVVYPMTGSGTVSMSLVGTTQQWKNYQVLLTAIDSSNFVVELKFVQLADLNSYISSFAFDSYQYFTSDGIGQQTTIYDALKFLSVKVTVHHPGGLEVGVCDTEWHGVRWCDNPDWALFTDYFGASGKIQSGWVSGQDLWVRFRIASQTSSTDPINNTWYGGIIRTSSGATGSWWDDLRMNYARLEDLVSSVNALFDSSAITESRALRSDTYGNYEGLFKIDSAYFVPGESYQVFFVYEENGVFKSCLSPVFSEFLDNDLPKLDFDTDNEVTLTDNSDVGTIIGSCVQNLAPCQNVTVCSTIDIASFDAALTAAGLPYTFHQLYSGQATGIQGEVFGYGTEYLQENAPSIFSDLNLQVTYVQGVSYQICGNFTVPETWAGETRYIFLLLKLALPGGEFYEIIFPFTLSVVEFDNLSLIGTAPQFVCEDAEDVEFCFGTLDNTYNFVAKVNGTNASNLDYVASVDSDFTGGDACLTIDYTKVEFEEDICFCLFGQKKTAEDVSPADCGCGDAIFEFTSTFQGGQVIYNCAIDLSDIIPAPAGASWSVTSSLFVGQQEFFGVNTGDVIFVGPKDNNQVLQVTLVTAEGCVYIISVSVPLDPTTIGVNVCPSVIPTRAIPCDKNPSIIPFCADPFYDVVLVDDGGTVDSFEYTFDFNTYTPYTVPISFNDGDEIFFRAVITYPEIECGTVELWANLKSSSCLPCYTDLPPINSCPSYLNLDHSWDEDLEELTLVDSNDASCSSPDDMGIYYSFDGINYVAYTVPISTVGEDYVYYQWSYDCDGCADSVVGMWMRPCADSCAGGGGGVIIIDALCDAITALPTSGSVTDQVYILGQDINTEECGKYVLNICDFLDALPIGEPSSSGSTFIYSEGGNCYKGNFSVCDYLSNQIVEVDPYPVDLSGLLFYYDDGMGNCYKIDISGYLGGGASPVPEQDEIQFQDEGVNLGTAGTVTELDFVGAGVTASRVANKVTVTIPGATDEQDKIQFQDEGVNLGTSGTVDTLNFTGTGITASRIGNVVTVDVPGNVDEQDQIQFKDEGSNLGTAGTVTSVDFVGYGVTASRSLNEVTVTIPDWQDKVQYRDEGVDLGTAGTVDTVDFVGTGVTATRVGDVLTVTIPGNDPEQDEIQFQDEGVNLGTAGTVTTVDFVGAGVTATRAINTVTVTIPDWQKKIQFYNDSVALGTSGTVTDFDVVGTFGKMRRVSNAVTLDFGPYEVSSNTDESHTDDEFIWFYYIDASGANRNVFLNAGAANGSLIYIKKTDNSANTVTIDADGADTINGAANYVLTGYNEGVCLKYDLDGSTGWHIVSDVLVNHTGEVTGQRNLALDKTAISNKTAVTAVGTDYVLIGDTSDSDNLKKALISDFANATHTGEVTGTTVLTVDKTAISNKTLVTAAKGDHVLVGDASDSDNLKKVKVETLRNYEKTGITVDGGGAVVTTGTKGFTQLKFPTATATLIGVTLLADASGSVEFDILKSSFAGFPTTSSIVGANAPELSSAQKAEITIDGGWTTSFSSGDVLEFEIVGTPATITRVHLIMYYELD